MKGMKVEVEGIDTIIATYKVAPDKALSVLKLFIGDVANEVYRKSQDMVPVRTNALRDSAVAPSFKVSGNQVSGEITYNTPYAVYVHENTDPSINYSKPGTGAKYLEIPTMEMAEQLPERMKTVMARFFK